MSAVSRWVIPSSSARWIVRIDSVSSVVAVELGHAHAAEAEGGDGQVSEGALLHASRCYPLPRPTDPEPAMPVAAERHGHAAFVAASSSSGPKRSTTASASPTSIRTVRGSSASEWTASDRAPVPVRAVGEDRRVAGVEQRHAAPAELRALAAAADQPLHPVQERVGVAPLRRHLRVAGRERPARLVAGREAAVALR